MAEDWGSGCQGRTREDKGVSFAPSVALIRPGLASTHCRISVSVRWRNARGIQAAIFAIVLMLCACRFCVFVCLMGMR